MFYIDSLISMDLRLWILLYWSSSIDLPLLTFLYWSSSIDLSLSIFPSRFYCYPITTYIIIIYKIPYLKNLLIDLPGQVPMSAEGKNKQVQQVMELMGTKVGLPLNYKAVECRSWAETNLKCCNILPAGNFETTDHINLIYRELSGSLRPAAYTTLASTINMDYSVINVKLSPTLFIISIRPAKKYWSTG